MALTFIQLVVLAVVGGLVLQALYQKRKVLPEGAKPLPGPKGRKPPRRVSHD
jgi:hypothetical protein